MSSAHLSIILDAANLLAPETLAKQHSVMDEAIANAMIDVLVVVFMGFTTGVKGDFVLSG